MENKATLIFFLILIAMPLSSATFTQKVAWNMGTTCAATIPSDIEYYNNYVYVTYNTVPATIAVIDVSDKTSPSVDSCFTGVQNRYRSVKFYADSTGEIDGVLVASSQDGVEVINVSGGGATLTSDHTFGVGDSGAVSGGNGNTGFSNIDVFRTSAIAKVFYEIDNSGTGSSSSVGSMNAVPQYDGLTKAIPYGISASDYYVASHELNALSFYSYTLGSRYYENVGDTSPAGGHGVDYSNNRICLFADTKVGLYSFSSSLRNITRTDNFTIGDRALDCNVLSGNTMIGLFHNISGGSIYTVEYNISAGLLNSVNKRSYGSGGQNGDSMIWNFPYLYIFNNDGSNQKILYIVEFENTEINASDLKKPSVEITSAPSALSINQSSSVAWTVANPETASIGENIYTKGQADYKETLIVNEQFNTGDFDFNTTCYTNMSSVRNIGTRNGVNYGTALSLTQCNNDIISNGGNYIGNIVGSFDIFSTNDTGSVNISFIDYSGVAWLTLDITNDNYVLNVRQDSTNTTIFSGIPLRDSSNTSIPVKIFYNFDTQSTQSDYAGNIYFSTNNYAQSNINQYNKTYCDTSIYCYIGDNPITIGGINNFYGIRIDDVSPDLDMAIDNYRVANTSSFPDYTQTNNLENTASVSYDSIGTKHLRIYASDTVNGKNYLNYDTATVQVTYTGAGSIPTNQSNAIVDTFNVFRNLAGFGGSTGALIISLLIILGSVTGILIHGGASKGVVGACILVSGIETLLFFVMGWMSMAYVAFFFLLDAGAMVILFGAVFGQRGG